MAHFAELDENNIVKQVIVIHNNELLDDNGNESEQRGIDFCVAHYGGTWIQTSYNGSIRKKYAGMGCTYNYELDAFIAPKPFNSWILNKEECIWEAPKNIPDTEIFYIWNEETLNWEIPVY